MALEFSICELRWERYPRVFENGQTKEWLQFQASRGLAANTLDAYGRDLNAYLKFLETAGISLQAVNRSTVATYIRSISELTTPRILKNGRGTRTTLSNATLQQHLTVVRLFHDYLVEENVCPRNPLRPAATKRSLIPRYHRLPWIPTRSSGRRFCRFASASHCETR